LIHTGDARGRNLTVGSQNGPSSTVTPRHPWEVHDVGTVTILPETFSDLLIFGGTYIYAFRERNTPCHSISLITF
jgi:hypothetical protein